LLAVVFVAALGAGAVWLLASNGASSRADEPGPLAASTAGPAPSGPPTSGVASSSEPTSSPSAAARRSPSPSPSASPSVSDRLAELRNSDRYIGFAEAERAQQYRFAQKAGYEAFAPFGAEGKLFEWANKRQLWNQIVPDIRDEALKLGPPIEEPMWDAENVVPTGIAMRWNDKDTERRGQFVELHLRYKGKDGAPVERVYAALIVTDERRRGEVVAKMPPYEIRERDASDFLTSRDIVRRRSWEWITEQPAVEGP
jgi:hypothetical protein